MRQAFRARSFSTILSAGSGITLKKRKSSF
jgi:hypothetical protein